MTTQDAMLLEAWRARRDPDAFRELVRRHGSMVYATCRRILGNEADAEDAAQECFVQLARHARDVKDSLAGWLHRVATHRSLDLLRSESRRRRREAAAVTEVAADDAGWKRIQPHVDEAIEALPADIRDVIVRYYLEQESYETVGRRLGVSHSTVRARTRKGIQAIRRHLRSAGVSVEVVLLSAALADRLSESTPPALVAEMGKVALSGISSGAAPAAASMAATRPAVTTSASSGPVVKTIAGAAIALPVALLIVLGLPEGRDPESAPVASSPPPAVGPAESAPAPGASGDGEPPPRLALAGDDARAGEPLPVPAASAGPAGRVVNEEGEPVAGADVLLYFHDSPWGLGNSIVERTTTDAAGRFALETGLSFETANGTTYTDHYFLFARHPEYALGWKLILSWAEPERHEIVLSTPVSRSFVVRDRDGNPLAGARVWLRGAGDRKSPRAHFRSYFNLPEEVHVAAETTDEAGRTTLTHLPDTRCSFAASLEGYGDQHVRGSAPDTEVVLTPAATVSGRVATADGRPVPGAVVWFEAGWRLNWYAYAVTDDAGMYRIEHLVGRGGSWCCAGGDGSYRVRVEHREDAAPERTIQVDPAQEIDGFDFDAVPGTLVRVTVREPGTERLIPGARLLAFGPGGRRGGFADSGGIVELCVPPGEFRCRFLSPPGDLAVLGDAGRAEPVRRVVSGAFEEVTLYAPGPLGRLLAMKAVLRLPDGSPAPGVEVHPASRLEYGTAEGRRGATTQVDGRFELERLGAAEGQELFLYAATADRRFVLAEVLPLDVDAPAMPEAFVMQPARSAEITITDGDGEPRAGMALKALPRAWEQTLYTAAHLSFATDASGVAVVEGLVPGLEYLVIEERARFSEPWWDFLHTEVVLLDEDEFAAADGERLPLKTVVLSDTLFVQVVDRAGTPVPIERIQSFLVVGDDGVRHTTGRVKVVEHGEDGSVTVPATSVSGRPRQAMEIVVVPRGRARAVEAKGVLPPRPWRRLELVAEASPGATEVDLSEGPRDVGEDDVAGRLVDARGAPVAGARVLLFPRKAFPEDPRPEWPVAVSGADGVFTIPGLGESWYTYAEIQARGFATTWITDLPIGRGFTVTLDSATRVRAAFELPDGSPAGAARVTFTKDKPTPRIELGRKVRGLRLDTRSDARGGLELPIEPGVYEILVTAESGHFARHAGVEIERGAVVTLPALLRPGIRLEATLLDSQTGAPVAGEKVWIWEKDRPGLMSPEAGTERVSDPAGKLVWQSLPPGEARFGFETGRYARRWSGDSVEAKRHGLGASWEGDPTFELARGMAPVTITLEKSVTVTGRVTSPAGDAVAGVFVSTEDPRFARATDEVGRYKLHLPAGNGTMQRVIACDREGRWANAVGESFRSAPGDSFTVDLALSRGAVIEGRVVDGDGDPIAAIAVTAAPADGLGLPYLRPRATTGADGRFRLTPVRAGEIAVYPGSVGDPSASPHAEAAKVTVPVEDGEHRDVGDLVWTGPPPDPLPVSRRRRRDP